MLRQKCEVQVWNLYSPLSHCWVLHRGGQYKLLCRHRHHHSIQDDNALLECVNTHVVTCQIWHILSSYEHFHCFQHLVMHHYTVNYANVESNQLVPFEDKRWHCHYFPGWSRWVEDSHRSILWQDNPHFVCQNFSQKAHFSGYLSCPTFKVGFTFQEGTY